MHLIKKISACLLVAVCMVSFFGLPVIGASSEPGKVVMVMIDKLSMNDLVTYKPPTMIRMVETGSIGLMSNRTAGRAVTEDGCLTIGAGEPLAGSGNDVMGFNTYEKYLGTDRDAGLAYQGLTGFKVYRNQVVAVNLPEIFAANSENQTASPGNLGEYLSKSGIKTCVLGNSDTAITYERNAVAIAMDNRGRVDLGDVSSQMNRPNGAGAADFETNYTALTTSFRQFLPEAGFFVLELSDLNRIDNSASFTEKAYLEERGRVIKNLDQMLNDVTGELNPERDLVIIFSPAAAANEKENKSTFSPLIMWGKGYEKGIVTSAATKREMIAANLDLAPTVLSFAGIVPNQDDFIGKVIKKRSVDGTALDKVDMVDQLNQRVSMTNRLRNPVVKGFVVLQIIVLVLCLISLYGIKRLLPFSRFMVVLMTVVPLILLLISLVPTLSEGIYVTAVILGSLVLTALLLKIFKRYNFWVFITIAILTLLALNVDAFFASPLLKSSVLGYDPMAGARYYGIGNEYMGIILGCTILIAASLYQWVDRKWARIVSILIFMVELYIIGAPSLGTNAGGAIAAAFGFLFSFLLFNDYRISWRMLMGVGFFVAALIAGLAVFDMNRPPELQTHIGRAANLIAAYGWNEAWQIIYRKLAMNWKLIQYTIWSRVFIGILLTIVIVLFNPRGILLKVKNDFPYLINGFIGIVFAAFAALAFNDSGIVAAATTSIFLGFPMLFLILGELYDTPDNTGLDRSNS